MRLYFKSFINNRIWLYANYLEYNYNYVIGKGIEWLE